MNRAAPTTSPATRPALRPAGRTSGLRVFAIVALSLLPFGEAWPSDAPPPSRHATGLPLPRFASLRAERVNLRQGPGTDYPTAWVFRRSGLPVEILKEFEGWRQIRDADGTTGWVQGAALSGRRAAVVMPWEQKTGAGAAEQGAMRAHPEAGSGIVAHVEANVIATVLSCDGRWCRIGVGDVRGYIEQSKLWGVYPGETIR